MMGRLSISGGILLNGRAKRFLINESLFTFSGDHGVADEVNRFSVKLPRSGFVQITNTTTFSPGRILPICGEICNLLDLKIHRIIGK